MKKSIMLVALFLVIGLIYTSSIEAIDSSAGGAGGQFLTVGPGARPSGMGGAFVGLANDINTLWWNPAGMGFFTSPEMMFMHDESFQEISYEYLAYVHRPVFANQLVFGGSAYYVNEASNINKTTISSFQSGASLGSFDAWDLALTVGVGYKWTEDLSVGANLRYIHEDIDNYSAAAFGSDFGLLYKVPSMPGFSMGLSAQNIGTDLKFKSRSDKSPINVRGGFGYVRALRADKDRLSLVLDLNAPVDDAFYVQGGGEYWVNNMFSMRVGYNGQSDDASSGLTAGAGFNYQNWFLDYAFTTFGKLGDSHRASVTYKFSPATNVSPAP